MSELIKMPVVSFRRIESPHDIGGTKTYIAVANVKSLSKELEDWRGINVRDPRLTSGVSKKIENSLVNYPSSFFFKNRGLTIISSRARYDNQTNTLELEMTDRTRNGLLDGGHTYAIIRDYIEGLDEDAINEIEAYIKIEILEGITELEDVVGIVEARNTSAQAKEQSFQELLKQYEEIKKVLAGKPFAERIAYKEYELLEDGGRKDIDVKEILSYLVCFDTDRFDDKKHPIKAYSTKSSVVTHFKEYHDSMMKYIPLLPTILELWDVIYSELPGAYNISGGKFGHLTGVTEVTGKPRMNKQKLVYTDAESNYRIPAGFIYPVLAAFRNLVNCDRSRCSWSTDPINFFRKHKKELASRVGGQARELKNPNKLGKDIATWRLCYDYVQLESLKCSL